MSQRKYVLDLLKETGMMGCKPPKTLVDLNLNLEINGDDEPMEKGHYQRLVGRLIYLSHTRPNIAFSVSCISQFMHSPLVSHMYVVYMILRYLKGTFGKGLFFKKNKERSVEVFVNADSTSLAVDRHSNLGYCSYMWGNIVAWRSKK